LVKSFSNIAKVFIFSIFCCVRLIRYHDIGASRRHSRLLSYYYHHYYYKVSHAPHTHTHTLHIHYTSHSRRLPLVSPSTEHHSHTHVPSSLCTRKITHITRYTIRTTTTTYRLRSCVCVKSKYEAYYYTGESELARCTPPYNGSGGATPSAGAGAVVLMGKLSVRESSARG